MPRLRGDSSSVMRTSRAPSPSDAQVDWSAVADPATALRLDAFRSVQYYESRLGRDAEQQDYLVAFQRSAARPVRDRVAEQACRPGPHARAWGAIERLLVAWSDGESLTSRAVPTIWFEYDAIERGGDRPPPSVCACITPRYCIDELHAPRGEFDLSLCEEVLSLLEDGGRPRASEILSELFDCLPEGARWIHLSHMSSRTPRAVKLYGVMRRDALVAFLKRAGFAGDLAQVEYALARLYPAALLGDELFLDLDLSRFRDARQAYFGLAVAQQHVRRGPERDPAHACVVSTWVEHGLCDPVKVEGLNAWLQSSATCNGARFIDLKLTWSAATGFAAKAYAGLYPSRLF